jgi:hypothetical protein
MSNAEKKPMIVDGTPIAKGDRVVLKTRDMRNGTPWTRTGAVLKIDHVQQVARVQWDDGRSPKATWVGAYVHREV